MKIRKQKKKYNYISENDYCFHHFVHITVHLLVQKQFQALESIMLAESLGAEWLYVKICSIGLITIITLNIDCESLIC